MRHVYDETIPYDDLRRFTRGRSAYRADPAPRIDWVNVALWLGIPVAFWGGVIAWLIVR